ncbi:MAG: hypothetical protein EAZ07_09290 [Cytophagales bacterium]|nr:MAG: hypothetical protein EAZ07_09290 [Cytophagales bacterium]
MNNIVSICSIFNKKRVRGTLLFPIYIISVISTYGQDLEKLLKKDKFKISGGINANQAFYMQRGGQDRRTPYNYFLSGRLAISYGQLSIPLSFSYSNQKVSYAQPFNILGFSPKYKWITTHVGFRSMTFSPYTLNGHTFLGGGIEVEPIKGWKSAVMYGRLMKAVAPNGNNRPAYERYGYGFKTEYTVAGGSIGFSLFSAKDNPLSIKDTNNPLLKPQESLSLGLSFSKKMKHWNFKFEGARTAYTRNINSAINSDSKNIVNAAFWTPRYTSTGYFNAFKVGVNYQFRGFTLGANFERIDPGYKTLGAFFFNEDLQSISGQFATAFFKNKLSLSASLGKQRNNLDKTKTSTMDRWVSAIQLSFVPTPKWNASLSFSSFQSFTNVRPPNTPLNSTIVQPSDTLSFLSVSRSGQGNISYIIKNNESANTNIMFSGSIQSAAQLSQMNNNYNPTFYNGFLSYNHGLPKQKMQSGLGLNANFSGERENQSIFIGPNLNASKSLFNEIWRLQANTSWSAVWLAGNRVSSIINLTWGNTFQIVKKHNLSCNFTYLNMKNPTSNQVDKSLIRAIDELNISLGYGYVF